MPHPFSYTCMYLSLQNGTHFVLLLIWHNTNAITTNDRTKVCNSIEQSRLFNSRVYVPTRTISSPVGVIGIGVTGSGIGFLIWRPGFGVWRQNRVWKYALDAGCRKKKPSGLRDLHRVGMTGLKNPIGYPLTACPDYMKQRLLETLATDIYFPLKKVWGANMETHVHASAARSPSPVNSVVPIVKES